MRTFLVSGNARPALLSLMAAVTILFGTGAAEAPVLSIDDVIARHEALDGKIVRVRGWLLERCQPLGCSIVPSRRSYGLYLSLGGTASFDQSLVDRRAVGHEILIEGQVDAGQFPEDGEIITDRPAQLRHPRLIRIFRNTTVN